MDCMQFDLPRRGGRWAPGALAGLLALTVFACGGDGDGDGGGAGGGGAAPLAISAGNAQPVAGAVVEITSDLVDVGGLTSDVGTLAVPTVTPSPALADFVGRQLLALLSTGPSTTINPLAVSTETLPCDPPSGGGSAGTVTFTDNDADDSGTATVGDSVTVAFDNCFDSEDGLTINGSLTIAIDELSGDDIEGGTDLTATVTATIDDLSFTDDGVRESVDGSMQLTLDIDGATGTESLTLIIDELTATNDGTSDVVSDATLSVSTDSTGASTVSVDATFTFAGLGGSVTVETIVAFESVNDEANPMAGEALITGADGSSVRLTAQPDGVNVVLAVDADGDGDAETEIDTTWAALDPDTVPG